MHHPRADIEHLYIKRWNDGSWLIQLELINYNKIKEILWHNNRQLVNIHKKQKKKYSISKEINKFAKQLNLTPKVINIKK